MEMNKLKHFIKNVHGWLWEKEGKLLYNLARNCKGKGVIVEIGSWMGKSTICLGMGSKTGNKTRIFAIDPHVGSNEEKHRQILGVGGSTFSEFEKNIKNAGLTDLVVPIIKTSEDAAKIWRGEKIELLWIDGAHESDLVELDYKLWEQYLIEGGVIAFHDTDNPAVKRIVEKYVFKGDKFRHIGCVYTITFAQKSQKITLKDKINNKIMLTLKDIEYYMNHLSIPGAKLVRRIWDGIWNNVIGRIGELKLKIIEKDISITL